MENQARTCTLCEESEVYTSLDSIYAGNGENAEKFRILTSKNVRT